MGVVCLCVLMQFCKTARSVTRDLGFDARSFGDRMFVVNADQVNRVLSIGSVVVLFQFDCKDLLVGDFSLPE